MKPSSGQTDRLCSILIQLPKLHESVCHTLSQRKLEFPQNRFETDPERDKSGEETLNVARTLPAMVEADCAGRAVENSRSESVN